ncbi:MAG: response regulator [Acidobacteriota bacterium]|nr:response regulator [Acidobacteriota bacterium]
MDGKANQIVMVVEDFEDNRFMMRRLLEMSGYRVVEAVNGQEAVEAARRERPDLILMDLGLPGTDGLTAVRKIREHTPANETPILIVSAYDRVEYRTEAVEAGCGGYLTKPLDPNQLLKFVRLLLHPDADPVQ